MTNAGCGGKRLTDAATFSQDLEYVNEHDRTLGGDGMDYVRANAILALMQWAAALFAVTLLSGAKPITGSSKPIKSSAGDPILGN